MARKKQYNRVTVAFEMYGDQDKAFKIYNEYRQYMSASKIFTTALLSYAGQPPSTLEENAQRIIDATTQNIQSMLNDMREDILVAYGEELMKHFSNLQVVAMGNGQHGASNTPVTIDEKQQMRNVANKFLDRMKKK